MMLTTERSNPRAAKRAVKKFFDTPTARIITSSLLFASPPIVSNEQRVTVTGRSSTSREPEPRRTTCIAWIRVKSPWPTSSRVSRRSKNENREIRPKATRKQFQKKSRAMYFNISKFNFLWSFWALKQLKERIGISSGQTKDVAKLAVRPKYERILEICNMSHK